MITEPLIERHPFTPFVPENAQILMLGTFPPKPERWSMPFYYPNKINDMWRVMGLVFFGDKGHFWNESEKSFRLPEIKSFLNERGIALYDTGVAVRRLKDNASDKFLEIVETVNLEQFFAQAPLIRAVVTTGEKATSVVAQMAAVDLPAIGCPVKCSLKGHEFELWRMPSTSRAYPLALEKKAVAYGRLFMELGYDVRPEYGGE